MVGATLIRTVKTGLVSAGVNFNLQPIVLGATIFLAVPIDSGRAWQARMAERRVVRPVAA